MKIKVSMSEVMPYKEKALDIYKEQGLYKLQEYCVCSGLRLVTVFEMVSRELPEDETLKQKIKEQIEFYNVEIVE